MDSLEKLSRKVYYGILYEDANYFLALDSHTGEPYKVDDITFAWLRREPYELFDYCKLHPGFKVIKVTFDLEMFEEST